MMPYPYYPYQTSYQPYYYPQIQQQQIQQPQASQQSTAGIIWVSGPQEAQMYPVAPNNAVALWEQSGKTIYLKSADATGKPTMRVYDLVERSETAGLAQDDKLPSYATKDELSTIVGAVKSLAGEVEQMKGDLYGMAGRKKKKAEVAEDDE